MSEEELRKKRAAQVRELFENLRSENIKLKKALDTELSKRNKQENSPFLSYLKDVGITDERSFIDFSNNLKKGDKMSEEKILKLVQDQGEVIKKLSEKVDGLSDQVTESTDTSMSIFDTMSLRDVEERLNSRDESQHKYFNAYLRDLGDKKNAKLKENAKEIHAWLKENTEKSFDDAMQALDAHYKENFGHYLKISDDEEQKEANKGQLDDKKDTNIPENSAGSSDGDGKTEAEKLEAEKKRVSELSEEEQNKIFEKEAEEWANERR